MTIDEMLDRARATYRRMPAADLPAAVAALETALARFHG